MDIFHSLLAFIYRIRYKLIAGSAVAALLAVYFTQYLPKRYNVTTTIFTGITSKTSLDDVSGRTDWNTSNNAHDNIINLVKSKSTLEQVSIGLIAQHLMYGDANKDNSYISAEHYREMLSIITPDVKAMVDPNSFENTVERLTKYRTEDRGNCIYAAFSWSHKHYSALALSKMKVSRKGASDMIEISYECDDPGIATNTLILLNKELAVRYEGLLLSASNDVVKHFEEQLAIAAKKLSESEDNLVEFNIENNIINYEEQTKHLAALNNNFEARYEGVLLQNSSSTALIKELEHQMVTRTKLVRENEVFLNTLSEISTINGKIAEIEIFGTQGENNAMLSKYKSDLRKLEEQIETVSDTIDSYKFSKEGVVITDMVGEWLRALMDNSKSTAELEVLKKRKQEIEEQYRIFSPVGPNIGRKDRAVRVYEESYLTLLQHLGLAKLKHKNILLDAGTLQVVTPPELPLISVSRKRPLYVMIAFLGAIIFIMGFYLVIEVIDRTIRDGVRAERLTSGKIIGAFPSSKRLKYRRFDERIKRLSISNLTNTLNDHIVPDKVMIINMLSIEPQEGKSYIAQQLEEYWIEQGFTVAYVSHHDELQNGSKQFITASSIYDVLSPEIKADIIIAEYVALKEHGVPPALLKEADVNLMILDAQRAWKRNDMSIFNHLRTLLNGESPYIYLNNADREAVEQYTGQLPPYTLLRNLGYRILSFGITAKK